MTLNRQQEATGLMLVAVSCWSFPGVFVRLMPHLDPLPLVGLRLGTACLAIAPVALSQRSRMGSLRAIRSWRCWLLGFCMLVYYGAATNAFWYAPIGIVALVIASAPLFAVILRLFAGQPVTRNELTGAGLAVTGVVVMLAPTLGRQNQRYGPEWLGVLLSVIAALTAALYTIGNRHLLQTGESPGAIPQALLTFCLGLLLLPFMLTEPHALLQTPHLAWVIPLGALSTAIPTVAVADASHRLPPVVATLINPLTAVCANVVAAVVIREMPTVWTAVGGAMVIGATWVAMRAQPVSSSP